MPLQNKTIRNLLILIGIFSCSAAVMLYFGSKYGIPTREYISYVAQRAVAQKDPAPCYALTKQYDYPETQDTEFGKGGIYTIYPQEDCLKQFVSVLPSLEHCRLLYREGDKDACFKRLAETGGDPAYCELMSKHEYNPFSISSCRARATRSIEECDGLGEGRNSCVVGVVAITHNPDICRALDLVPGEEGDRDWNDCVQTAGCDDAANRKMYCDLMRYSPETYEWDYDWCMSHSWYCHL